MSSDKISPAPFYLGLLLHVLSPVNGYIIGLCITRIYLAWP